MKGERERWARKESGKGMEIVRDRYVGCMSSYLLRVENDTMIRWYKSAVVPYWTCFFGD